MAAKPLSSKGRHPAFEPPSDLEIRIWRYMDFTQFVSMLEQKGLLFTRADLLLDRFEGTMSQPLWDYLEATSDAEEHAGLVRLTRNWSFVNCWHMNEFESAAMWKIYSTSNESVCIQTTYERLRSALDEDVYIGTVNYISYERDKIPAGNTFWPLVHKRKSFEYERELRAIWSGLASLSSPELPDGTRSGNQTAPQQVIWKHVDLAMMIQRIYVSPTCGA